MPSFGAGFIVIGAIFKMAPTFLSSNLLIKIPYWNDITSIVIATGVAITILGIEKRLEQIETLNEDIRLLTKSIHDVSEQIMLDTIGKKVMEMVRCTNELSINKFSHAIAGKEIIKDYYFNQIETLIAFVNKTSTSDENAIIEETSVIHKFITALLKVLPNNSIWMGINTINDIKSWNEKEGQIDFIEWANLCRTNSSSKKLAVLRCYCFCSDKEYEDMKPYLDIELKYGIKIKTLIYSDEKPADISILRHSNEYMYRYNDTISKIINSTKPICGLKFSEKHLLSQDSLEIYNSQSSKLSIIENYFENYWNKGEWYRVEIE